jgi:hypothetical protein
MNIGPQILNALGWLLAHAREEMRAGCERGRKNDAGP